MYYIDPDGKTVHKARVALNNCIRLDNGSLVQETSATNKRMFAVHPDENSFCRREEDGTISYLERNMPESKRMFFRP